MVKDSTTITDIHQRSQTSYIYLYNGIVSHGAQFGRSLAFCQPNMQKKKRKTNAIMILAPHAVFYACFYRHTQTPEDAVTYAPDELRLF